MKVRVSRPILRYLDGSSLFQQGQEDHGYGEAGNRLRAKLGTALGHKDGSVVVDIDREEAAVLDDYAETLYLAATDDASGHSFGDAHARAGLAEVSAARALRWRLKDILG